MLNKDTWQAAVEAAMVVIETHRYNPSKWTSEEIADLALREAMTAAFERHMQLLPSYDTGYR